ncbi:uncharacterized [Tachysurus ichikawai]
MLAEHQSEEINLDLQYQQLNLSLEPSFANKFPVQNAGGDVKSLSTRCLWDSLAFSASLKGTITTSIISIEAVMEQLG